MILCQTFLSRSVCIVWYFVLGMKYMCKTCQKPCNDIIEHVKKVHGFSESYINNQLKTSSNSYLHAFEEIKWLRKNPMDIILVERLNRKDVKRIKVSLKSLSSRLKKWPNIPVVRKKSKKLYNC